jgi:hypothetical protein
MWKLYFIQCIMYKEGIIWMIVNLSHVSCQMFLVKIVDLIHDFISCVVLSHVFHWIYPMWFGKCSLCCIIWMIVNLSHVSCQMFLVKLLISYMISSHVLFFHMCFIEFIPCGLANVPYVVVPHNSHVSFFTCVLWNLYLGALSITPY